MPAPEVIFITIAMHGDYADSCPHKLNFFIFVCTSMSCMCFPSATGCPVRGVLSTGHRSSPPSADLPQSELDLSLESIVYHIWICMYYIVLHLLHMLVYIKYRIVQCAMHYIIKAHCGFDGSV